MAEDILSQRISELSQGVEELQAKYVSSPENCHEIISDALKSLQVGLEDLQIEIAKQIDAEKAVEA